MRGRRRPRVVADASVLVKWLVEEDYTQDALRLRRDHFEKRVELYAPDLALLEAASALRKYVLHGIMSPRDAERGIELLAASGVVYEPVEGGLALAALRLSLQLGITVYDAVYIALARELGATFYTADERLLANTKVRQEGLVVHISAYPEQVDSRHGG